MVVGMENELVVPVPDYALVKEPTRPEDYTTHDDEDDA